MLYLDVCCIVAFKEGRKFYLLPVLSVGDAFPEIGRRAKISQPLLPLLHPPHSYFTLTKQRMYSMTMEYIFLKMYLSI